MIIRQGDHGHEFFIIKEGEAEVLIQQKKQAYAAYGMPIQVIHRPQHAATNLNRFEMKRSLGIS